MQASISNPSTQSVINQQILDQLQSIGYRVDKLEQNQVRKSSDLKKIKNNYKTKQDIAVNEHNSLLQNAGVTSKIISRPVKQLVPNLA